MPVITRIGVFAAAACVAAVLNVLQAARLADSPVEREAVIPAERAAREDLLALNDPTVRPSPGVARPWLPVGGAAPPPPPAQLLLTDFGWNGPNRTRGLEFPRTVRTRELLQGWVDHPWFHPAAWGEYAHRDDARIDPDVRYYVLLDVDTCIETNYPVYLGRFERNADTALDRSTVFDRATGGESSCYKPWRCSYIHEVLETRLFATPNVSATLVVFECDGWGPPVGFRTRDMTTKQVAIASLGSQPHQLRADVDQGLPPPANKPVQLDEGQIRDIELCREEVRPYLLTFSGNFHHEIRRELGKLHNGRDVLAFRRKLLTSITNDTFQELLAKSKFAAVPRGDSLFSYRFTEVLSAGAIPVVLADGWVLPFRRELVDWRECAVVLPENRASAVLEFLSIITKRERCQRRNRCFEIYTKYMQNTSGTVNGIIEGLERSAVSNMGML